MRTNRLAMMMVAGAFSLVLGACGDSGNGGAGGTTGSAGSSGGSSVSSSALAGSGGGLSTAAGGSSAVISSGGASAAGSGGSSAVTGGGTGTGGAGTGGKTTTGGTSTQSPGGTPASGGTTTASTGTAGATAGKTATGGTGGTVTGGTTSTGGSSAGGKTSTGSGTCTASKPANMAVSGSGKFKVVVETNTDSAMACGTIYRPQDLGGAEKFPIFAWGEGACSRDGKANAASMAEIASHGYFVIADGPLNGGTCASIAMPNTAADIPNMGKPLLGYIKWAIAENDKPCSAYHGSLDTTKVAADGFSCGGLMASGTSADPIMTTYGITSSGLTGADQNFYGKIHTPFKALTGSTDMAYDNAKRDYEQISALGIPSVFFSKNGAGHGGDLTDKNGGDFTKVNLAWLNWQLKGDTTATGKGFLIGADCPFCKGGWEVKSKNIP